MKIEEATDSDSGPISILVELETLPSLMRDLGEGFWHGDGIVLEDHNGCRTVVTNISQLARLTSDSFLLHKWVKREKVLFVLQEC